MSNWTRFIPDTIDVFEIEVTIKGYEGYKCIYEVLGKDAHGDFVLRMVSEKKPNEPQVNYFGNERLITVDPKWFTDEPKRIIKRID